LDHRIAGGIDGAKRRLARKIVMAEDQADLPKPHLPDPRVRPIDPLCDDQP